MIGWFIVTVLSFLLLYWFVRNAHMIKVSRGNRRPIGLKVWSLTAIIVLSFFPIINIIADIVIIVWILLLVGLDEAEWDEIFPPKPLEQRSKLWKILNKDLRK